MQQNTVVQGRPCKKSREGRPPRHQASRFKSCRELVGSEEKASMDVGCINMH